jgi:hypothetical protein
MPEETKSVISTHPKLPIDEEGNCVTQAMPMSYRTWRQIEERRSETLENAVDLLRQVQRDGAPDSRISRACALLNAVDIDNYCLSVAATDAIETPERRLFREAMAKPRKRRLFRFR